MATNMHLDYTTASQIAVEIEELGKEINNTLNDLHNYLSENIDVNKNVWTGEAANHFMQVWKENQANFQNYVNLVTSVSEKVDYAAQTTRTYDQNN